GAGLAARQAAKPRVKPATVHFRACMMRIDVPAMRELTCVSNAAGLKCYLYENAGKFACQPGSRSRLTSMDAAHHGATHATAEFEIQDHPVPRPGVAGIGVSVFAAADPQPA
ncbi:MAG TPA: hypothetical protein VK830_06600, partial [Xanthomonadales bacterium]|nr:hypothetical protein [Xanthomonadales bacterium]